MIVNTNDPIQFNREWERFWTDEPSEMVVGDNLYFKVCCVHGRWRIVAVIDGFDFILPFKYSTKQEAESELKKAIKKRGVKDETVV